MRGLRILLFVLIAVGATYFSKSSTPTRKPVLPPSDPVGRAEVIATPEKPARGKPITAGNLFADAVSFQIAVYVSADTKTDPAALLKKWTAEKYTKIKFIENVEATSEAHAACQITPVPIADYMPPEESRLQYASRGLSDDDKKSLAASRRVIVVDFNAPKPEALSALKQAQSLMLDLAEETHGYLWDENSRLAYARETWRKQRVAAWKEEFPDLSSHVNVHMYQNGEFSRLVTLGMDKFGLPDVCVEDLTKSDAPAMLNVVNLVCQTMAEKGRIDIPGILNVDVAALKNGDLRASLTKSFRPKATGIAAIQLSLVPTQDGDAKNRLLEINFPASLGAGTQQRQVALIQQIYGGEDAIRYVKDTDATLVAAKARATEKIKNEFKLWKTGLPVGEHLMLKAPFKTPTDGIEWMWVEVTKWNNDGAIEGVLANDPFEIPTLKMGAKVRVTQDSLFDYIHSYADGHMEGNETGEIIEKMEESKR